MSAYRSHKGFEQKSAFYTWTYRIAINLLLNFLKKRNQEKGREDYVQDFSCSKEYQSSFPSPERHSEKKQCILDYHLENAPNAALTEILFFESIKKLGK